MVDVDGIENIVEYVWNNERKRCASNAMLLVGYAFVSENGVE